MLKKLLTVTIAIAIYFCLIGVTFWGLNSNRQYTITGDPWTMKYGLYVGRASQNANDTLQVNAPILYMPPGNVVSANILQRQIDVLYPSQGFASSGDTSGIAFLYPDDVVFSDVYNEPLGGLEKWHSASGLSKVTKQWVYYPSTDDPDSLYIYQPGELHKNSGSGLLTMTEPL